MRYTNKTLPLAWFNGLSYGKANSTRVDGDCYYSFDTVIARRIKLAGYIGYVMNNHRFSSRTGAHQSGLRRALPETNTFEVDVPGFGGRLEFTPFTLIDHYLAIGTTESEGERSRFSHKRDEAFIVRAGKIFEAERVRDHFNLGGYIHGQVHSALVSIDERWRETIRRIAMRKVQPDVVRLIEASEAELAKRVKRDTSLVATALP